MLILNDGKNKFVHNHNDTNWQIAMKGIHSK